MMKEWLLQLKQKRGKGNVYYNLKSRKNENKNEQKLD